MTYYNKYQSIARRQMLFGATAMIGLGLMANTAFANGGRDPKPTSGGTSNTTIEIGNQPRTKTRKKRVMLTQANYHKISPKGLKIALKGLDAGEDYWIEGFSKKMSRTIFEMTLLDRTRTLEIFKEMLTKKTSQERRMVLQGNEFVLHLEIGTLTGAIRPKTIGELLLDDNKEKFDKLKEKRRKLRAYKKLLQRWSKNPMEGAVPPSE